MKPLLLSLLIILILGCSEKKKTSPTSDMDIFIKQVTNNLGSNVNNDTILLGLSLDMSYQEAARYLYYLSDSNENLICTGFKESLLLDKSIYSSSQIKEKVNDAIENSDYLYYLYGDSDRLVGKIYFTNLTLNDDKNISLVFDEYGDASFDMIKAIYEQKYGLPGYFDKREKISIWSINNTIIKIEQGEKLIVTYAKAKDYLEYYNSEATNRVKEQSKKDI